MPESPQMITALGFLAALERGASDEELTAFLTGDSQEIELPNRFTPQGATRDFAAMMAAAERGRKLMSSQKYEVLNTVESEGLVVLEVAWSGTLAHDLGSLAAGFVMRANVAMFMTFRDGKIAQNRHYDCAEPW